MAAKKTTTKRPAKKTAKPAAKRMGRPPRSADGLSERRVIVRLTDSEHARIKEAAAHAGITMAELLRDSTLSVVEKS